jgi:catechol 2,3-dioxygenase-like lactoylglutathione lyase family enzyme
MADGSPIATPARSASSVSALVRVWGREPGRESEYARPRAYAIGQSDRLMTAWGYARRDEDDSIPEGAAMPISTGFNHVATLTTDMHRTVTFYEQVFDAVVIYEVLKSEHHPWMKIVDLGGGGALNIFEVDAADIIGERRSQTHRGAIDHFAVAVDSRAVLETVRERMLTAGAEEVGDIQQLGQEWSLFYRDPDGMELEVCCPVDG